MVEVLLFLYYKMDASLAVLDLQLFFMVSFIIVSPGKKTQCHHYYHDIFIK